MGEGAAEDKRTGGSTDEEVRAAIVASARRLAERDGIENLSFGKVAKDTGLQRVQVLSLFPRKEDLLMTIVSEDLGALAHDVRSEATACEMPQDVAEMARDVSAALAQDSQTISEAPAQAERKLARRADIIRVLEGGASAANGNSDKGEAPQPDAWLQRRLRTFERAMNSIETRQAQVEKESRAAIVTAQETVAGLEATIKALQERADAADARVKASANELRAAINQAELRIQTVETVARAALAEEKPDGPSKPVVDFVPTPLAKEPEPREVEPVVTASDEPDSFLAKARKNAMAAHAAAMAAIPSKPKKKPIGTSRYLLGALIVLVVFIAAAQLAFSQGVHDGRRDALMHIVRIVPGGQGTTVARHVTPLDQLTLRARLGDAKAEMQVGARYMIGDGTTKDLAAAARWLSLAAVHGQPVAQYLLGTLYERGEGLAADKAKAVQWYEAAALQGNRKAMHDLAIAYAQGLGVKQDLNEAARWFSRAASFGYVDSQFNLAVLYERGDGVPQSLLDACKWYMLASRQGDPEAKARVEALRTQLDADDLAAAQRAANAFHAQPFNKNANALPV
ncbi:MAG: sel1 repeat family protein [Alphaproteobacteria bacterium]|nr:sel1 repeat family protein [Alphaproteobacteria bacterium]